MRYLRLFAIFLLITNPAYAGGLIRDAEIENTLRNFSYPIFKAAGLKPTAVNIFMVQDDSLNAFVAGGQNLFLHTGLIMQTTSPDMLMGVIAHETGHMAGGHLAKGGEKLKDAQLGTIMATVLGAAAAAVSGKPEAAAVVLGGASNSVERNFLSFSRANENAADQAALGYMDKIGASSTGMIKMFTLLRQQERRRLGKPDPYLMTHPLGNDRIALVQAHVDRSSIPPGAYPPALKEEHARMVAKLYAFIEKPEKTLRTYPANDNSVAARMARAVAFFMQAKVDEAETIMIGLLKEHPDDAYLYDLMGQIMFESARIDKAHAAYSKAVKLKPNEPLILAELAKVELARNTPADTSSAVAHLERSLNIDRENAGAWRLLATAYGKQNNAGMASLALAEESLLIGDDREATAHAEKAIERLAASSPARQRAEDAKVRAAQIRKERRDAENMF